MNLKKKEFQPLSTEQGTIAWAAGLWFMLFFCVLLCVCLQLDVYRSTSAYLEDALAASNLAAIVIDVEEYGISHKVLIDDPFRAYERYRMALKGNLHLNEAWECANRGLITSPVRIDNFTVYNVQGEEVEIYHFSESGECRQWKDRLNSTFAPNGQRIEHSGIYSEISCSVRGVFNQEVQANKKNLADVVGQ